MYCIALRQCPGRGRPPGETQPTECAHIDMGGVWQGTPLFYTLSGRRGAPIRSIVERLWQRRKGTADRRRVGSTRKHAAGRDDVFGGGSDTLYDLWGKRTEWQWKSLPAQTASPFEGPLPPQLHLISILFSARCNGGPSSISQPIAPRDDAPYAWLTSRRQLLTHTLSIASLHNKWYDDDESSTIHTHTVARTQQGTV